MFCPHCNAPLKDNATFCPHCGSDADTGWKAGAEFADLESPDYDEIIENEFGTDTSGKKKKANPIAVIAAIVVAIAFIAAMIVV